MRHLRSKLRLLCWRDVLEDSLRRSRTWMHQSGLLDPAFVDDVEEAVERHASYLAAVEPVCFLDDTTTKNVIVDGGRLSGIVDVDFVCFGDPLYTPALTRTALLSVGADTVYIDAWLEALQPSREQREALDLYTALFAVGLLAEAGLTFNRASAPPVDQVRQARLLSLLHDLLDGLR